MKFYKHVIYWMTCISIFFTITTIVFTYLQIVNDKRVVFSIINNISICVLTGCAIALLQSIIGYINTKHDCLLVFYKDLLMLEEKIVHYPFNHIGFIDVVSGLRDVRVILDCFNFNTKLSYMQIDFGGHCDKILKAAKNLYASYQNEIKAFDDFSDALCEGIRFMDKTDEDLYNEGITDITYATNKMNEYLQSKEKNIENTYNNKEERQTRSISYNIL